MVGKKRYPDSDHDIESFDLQPSKMKLALTMLLIHMQEHEDLDYYPNGQFQFWLWAVVKHDSEQILEKDLQLQYEDEVDAPTKTETIN